ncbi:putative peptidase S8 propeptide/proteinase inhibitor I9 [Lupinus albus]|uniref:Putative peptidase S8 propeptide/proteinase inhibitor I9 n=1 Tax=Lupinus albus TaxID=3870 RepID=A0A6A4NK65_LUPAL|nr:putative peptidase S8 propeptide/proteinase inhibitor I9 [Lupinus albus]
MAMHLNLKPRHSLNMFLIFFLFIYFTSLTMSDSAATPLGFVASLTSSAPAVNIVYTEKPEGEDPELYYIRILSPVLGSEEAAKESLDYSYKNAASGFSAKLTPQQVVEISSK